MNMNSIHLLEELDEQLDSKDFDLEVWKASALSAFTKLFGPSDPKVSRIRELKIDYSSWMLRDCNSTYRPVETCKRIGRVILKDAMTEARLSDYQMDKAAILSSCFNSIQIKTLMARTTSMEEKLKIVGNQKKEVLAKMIVRFLEAPIFQQSDVS